MVVNFSLSCNNIEVYSRVWSVQSELLGLVTGTKWLETFNQKGNKMLHFSYWWGTWLILHTMCVYRCEGILLHLRVKLCKSLYFKVCVSRGSCVKSDGFLQVMSLEATLVWSGDYKFGMKKMMRAAPEVWECGKFQTPRPNLCLRLEAQGYISHYLHNTVKSLTELSVLKLDCR